MPAPGKEDVRQRVSPVSRRPTRPCWRWFGIAAESSSTAKRTKDTKFMALDHGRNPREALTCSFLPSLMSVARLAVE
jgi:hypothetical protein